MIDDAQLIAKLLSAGLADQSVVQKGIELAEDNNSTLYAALIVHQLVAESAVVQIASDVLNVPSVDLSDSDIDEEVAHILPADIARRNQTLPLEMIDDGTNRVLRLAMADPIDVMAMDEVASHTGVNIRPVLVGPADLQRALERLYPTSNSSDASEEAILLEIPENSEGMDSWAALFEDSEAAQSASVEDSAVISQEMRDRPPTDVFEVVSGELDELDDGLDDEFDDESVFGHLEDESEGTRVGRPIDLDEWDLDDAFYDSEGPEDSEDDDEDQKEENASDQEKDDETDRYKDGEYDDYNSRTRVGLGTRGYDELDLDDSHFADPDSDAEDNAEDSDAEDSDVEDSDAEDSESEDVPEESEPGGDEQQNLEHSIEMAFNTKHVEVLEVADEKNQPPPTVPRTPVQELLQEASDSASEDEEKEKEQNEEKKNSVVPSSIRDALKRVSSRKKEKKTPSDDPSPYALGRINVKKIAVPAFKGAVEKRSDKKHRDEPATRELSAADFASLAFGDESQPSEGLDESTKAGGDDVKEIAQSMRSQISQITEIVDEVDDGILLRGLLQLIVDKGLISPEEIVAMVQELADPE